MWGQISLKMDSKMGAQLPRRTRWNLWRVKWDQKDFPIQPSTGLYIEKTNWPTYNLKSDFFSGGLQGQGKPPTYTALTQFQFFYWRMHWTSQKILLEVQGPFWPFRPLQRPSGVHFPPFPHERAWERSLNFENLPTYSHVSNNVTRYKVRGKGLKGPFYGEVTF